MGQGWSLGAFRSARGKRCPVSIRVVLAAARSAVRPSPFREGQDAFGVGREVCGGALLGRVPKPPGATTGRCRPAV
jgi:hypothetical protein